MTPFFTPIALRSAALAQMHPTRGAYGRFLAFTARTGANREGQQRVDLNCSSHRPGMPGICAQRPPAKACRLGFNVGLQCSLTRGEDHRRGRQEADSIRQPAENSLRILPRVPLPEPERPQFSSSASIGSGMTPTPSSMSALASSRLALPRIARSGSSP